MSNGPNVNALEAIIQEAVMRYGDNWDAVGQDIKAHLGSLSGASLEAINAELKLILANADESRECDNLH